MRSMLSLYTMPLDAVRVMYHIIMVITKPWCVYVTTLLAGVPVGSVRVHSHTARGGILVRVQLGFS
jgi:hypothetical protein